MVHSVPATLQLLRMLRLAQARLGSRAPGWEAMRQIREPCARLGSHTPD